MKREEINWSLQSGYWMLDAGYWMLVTGYWSLVWNGIRCVVYGDKAGRTVKKINDSNTKYWYQVAVARWDKPRRCGKTFTQRVMAGFIPAR